MNTIHVAVEGPSTNNMCMPAIVIQTAPQLYIMVIFFSSLKGWVSLFFMLADLVALMLLHMKYS
jgi:hypothetical protein